MKTDFRTLAPKFDDIALVGKKIENVVATIVEERMTIRIDIEGGAKIVLEAEDDGWSFTTRFGVYSGQTEKPEIYHSTYADMYPDV